MIVVDASAAVAAVLHNGAARAALASDGLHAPHLIDAEVTNALRRRVLTGALHDDEGHRAVVRWRSLAVTRYVITPLLERVWELRRNMTACDATYIALAEHLGCAVVTLDGSLSRAHGPHCPLTILPS